MEPVKSSKASPLLRAFHDRPHGPSPQHPPPNSFVSPLHAQVICQVY